jgi:hypothetical protein
MSTPPEKRDFGHLVIDGSTLQPIEELQGRGFPTFIDADNLYAVPTLSADAEATFECETYINPNLMRKLCGFDQAIDALCNIGCNTYSLQFSYDSQMMVPVRKHRKKRIAKKWAKRYGYKFVLVSKQLENVSLVQDNGEIDILGRTERRIVR